VEERRQALPALVALAVGDRRGRGGRLAEAFDQQAGGLQSAGIPPQPTSRVLRPGSGMIAAKNASR
jgi:hypothetical protein